MSEQSPNLVESETWKAMEDFSEGIDTYRLPQTDELAGSQVVLTLDDGHTLALQFASGQRVAWLIAGPTLNGSGEVAYDGVALAEGGFWVDIAPALASTQSITAVFHPAHGWALVVHSVINC